MLYYLNLLESRTIEGNSPVKKNKVSLLLLFLSTSGHQKLVGISRN